jgi:hypothetical protein
MSEARKLSPEPTPVDDIRRVRESLNRSFGGDVRRLAAHAREVAEKYRAHLGLKLTDVERTDVPPSPPER